MAITVEAVYEGGVLKLAGPLPFPEHDTVRVTVESRAGQLSGLSGLLGWTGDAETVRRVALDAEFLPEEDS